MINRKEHLTIEGLRKIVNLKAEIPAFLFYIDIKKLKNNFFIK